MDDFPRLSSKELLILQMLVARGEMYGLEMVKESAGHLKRGTVYVTLSRMEDKGYVDPVAVSGSPRRKYRATGHGARVLHALGLAQAAMAQFGA